MFVVHYTIFISRVRFYLANQLHMVALSLMEAWY
jgi:hypothetical protein